MTGKVHQRIGRMEYLGGKYWSGGPMQAKEWMLLQGGVMTRQVNSRHLFDCLSEEECWDGVSVKIT